MHGLIMDEPLLIPSLIDYAAASYAEVAVVSCLGGGRVHRTDYGEVARRARQLADVLTAAGIGIGDRVATLAWNDHRHLEMFYGVSGIGAVLHTINPRLFPEQIAYIVNHAEDRMVFLDPAFLPVVEAMRGEIAGVERFVLLAGADEVPDSPLPNLVSYEDLIAPGDPSFAWPTFDERTAATLCYTSGTTGRPKGVLYSHRSTVLHTLNSVSGDLLGLSRNDTVLCIVPMAHAVGWALPYSGPLTGAKLVLPGPGLDGASICRLIEEEGVTFAPGVPTVFAGLLDHVGRTGARLDSLQRIAVGGSALPRAMLRLFEEEHDVRVLQAWGLTESSNFGTLGRLKPAMAGLPADARYALQEKQGLGVYGLRMRIVDDAGNDLPHDGAARGRLLVRGPWVAAGYFKEPEASPLTADGWLETGDIATIDPDGLMQVVDRAKDLVKSGGEWISSIELESVALSHPGVAEACVVAVPDEKWMERPLLLVVRAAGSTLDRAAMLGHFEGRVPRWWVPDDVVFLDALPRTATGKLNKAMLRETHGAGRRAGSADPPAAPPPGGTPGRPAD